jgi:hypothetical protein
MNLKVETSLPETDEIIINGLDTVFPLSKLQTGSHAQSTFLTVVPGFVLKSVNNAKSITT